MRNFYKLSKGKRPLMKNTRQDWIVFFLLLFLAFAAGYGLRNWQAENNQVKESSQQQKMLPNRIRILYLCENDFAKQGKHCANDYDGDGLKLYYEPAQKAVKEYQWGDRCTDRDIKEAIDKKADATQEELRQTFKEKCTTPDSVQ